ncbi:MULTISPECIES: hypothetical protein [Pseudonocardiaceae]|uniref:Uncharacterized protein n=3 Tax=Pseudonocardiaceae TaxID=2070 RepID=A0A2N3X162_9PSEU|nr:MULTISPECIES: hypothetical protein [Pseudonocardiaceae]EHR48388.1 hypothetical protein SacmaDRAFT_0072 [Saccharomonospora marina XMU15]PKV99865.1 hypothetical protein ATK30_0856 [Amycolatopsis niigatensis]
MIAVVITASAALAFVCCLLRLAWRRRQTESAYAGSHRRAPRQPPNRVLRHAIATAGTHGLGMIRKTDGS